MALDKKQFNLIVGGVGAVAVLVVLFGVLDVKLPAMPSFSFGKEEVVKEAPKHPIHDEQTFAALTQNYHVEPPKATSLTFDISLPKEWTVDNVSTDGVDAFSKQLIGEVARLRSPYIGVYRPEVVVQTTMLKHDIEAGTWLKHYILTNSYIPQGEVNALDLTRANGAFTYIQEGTVMLVQAAVQFNGREAVIARFEMPLAFQEPMGFLQKRAIESFKLTAAEEKTVEEQRGFTLAELLKFSYPASWEIAPPNLRDIDRLSVQLFNRNSAGAFQGYIQMFLIRRKPDMTLEKEAVRLREYVTNGIKVNINTMTDMRPLPALERYPFNRMETYNVTSTANTTAAPQELRLVSLGNGESYVFIVMLSPQPSTDLYNWGRNKRALDLIAVSLQ